ALQLDPNYGPLCTALGKYLLQKGAGVDSLDRAEELLVRATKLKSYYPDEVFFNLGQVYVQKGAYRKAVDALKASIRLQPTDERAYYALANAYRRTGDIPEAKRMEARFQHLSLLHVQMQTLEARLSHQTGDADVSLRLARVYRELGLTPKALEQFAV